MLNLHNTIISKQNLGNVIVIFLSGEKEACDAVFNSFYHHGAVNTVEYDYDEDLKRLHFFISGEDCEQRLFESLAKMALGELIQAGSKGRDPMPEAWQIAEDRIEAMDCVDWYYIMGNVWQQFDLGHSVRAEKGTGNANDDLLGVIVSSAASHEGVSKAEAEAELDPDLVEA